MNGGKGFLRGLNLILLGGKMAARRDGHNQKGPTPLSKEPAEVARAAIQGQGRKRIVIPGAMIGCDTRAMYGKRLS